MSGWHILTETFFAIVLAVSIRVIWLSFKREWLRFLDTFEGQEQ